MATSSELGLFPLACPVLYPLVQTPLHVFEPRYLQLTEQSLAGDRRIGMATILPAHVGEAAGDPPLHAIGCAGRIVSAERRPDGRYDIVLAGLQRFSIQQEIPRPPHRLHRRARVEYLGDPCPDADLPEVARLRERVMAQLARLLGGETRQELLPLSRLADGVLVNTLAARLALEAGDKQLLLESHGIPARYRQLSSLLEFRLAQLHNPAAGRTATLH